MLGFVVGLLTGGFLGITVMAILVIGKNPDEMKLKY